MACPYEDRYFGRSTLRPYISTWLLIQINIDIKGTIEVFQERMFGVFLWKEGFLHGDLPIDAERFIEDTDATIGLGGIEVIALVLEHGGFAKDGKAVGEASWYEELTMVIFG